VAALCATLAVGCGDDTNVAQYGGPSQANPLDDEERALLDELNRARTDAGAAALTECAVLNESATWHSDDMRDNDFTADTGTDESLPRERACSAGYEPACGNAGFAEVIGVGSRSGALMFDALDDDPDSALILLDVSLVVVGVGRSLGGEGGRWTIDMGTEVHASCE
jgi:uncharacterized protein YkwD